MAGLPRCQRSSQVRAAIPSLSSCSWLTFFFRSSRISSALSHITALGALRLIRSWNQTGQKFAGEPDTVKTFLIPNPELLWVFITLAYVVVTLQTLQSLSLAGLPFLLTTFLVPLLFSATLAFKLAFTAEDAPELVVGFARTLLDILQGPSLIFRARIIFGLLTALFGFAVYRAKVGGPQVTQSAGKFSPPPSLSIYVYKFRFSTANIHHHQHNSPTTSAPSSQ